jgi:hypothetical protein
MNQQCHKASLRSTVSVHIVREDSPCFAIRDMSPEQHHSSDQGKVVSHVSTKTFLIETQTAHEEVIPNNSESEDC